MLPTDETNRNSYGMVKINIKELKNLAFNEKISITVECDPYKVESK
jgi:hypothetical protein